MYCFVKVLKIVHGCDENKNLHKYKQQKVKRSPHPGPLEVMLVTHQALSVQSEPVGCRGRAKDRRGV